MTTSDSIERRVWKGTAHRSSCLQVVGRHLDFLNFKRFPTKKLGNDKAGRPLIDRKTRKAFSDLLAFHFHFIEHGLKGQTKVFTI